MAAILDELAAQAMRLPPMERGELIHRLIVSLDEEPTEPPEVVAKAWDDEIARRVTAMDAGTAEFISGEVVFAQLEAIAKGER